MSSEDHEARITRNEEDIQKIDTDGKVAHTEIWQAIDTFNKALAYRLPLWATFLIAALSSTCTGLIVRAMM